MTPILVIMIILFEAVIKTIKNSDYIGIRIMGSSVWTQIRKLLIMRLLNSWDHLHDCDGYWIKFIPYESTIWYIPIIFILILIEIIVKVLEYEFDIIICGSWWSIVFNKVCIFILNHNWYKHCDYYVNCWCILLEVCK